MKPKGKSVLNSRLYHPITDDLAQVEADLFALVKSDDNLLYQISYQLLCSGGKRLRPALVLLSGRFFHYQLERVLPVALAMELLHMATLVHDDIIDESVKRRGQVTVNQEYGDKVAVLNGDLLFAHAIKILSQLPDRTILQEMMDAIFSMCKGEVEEVIQNGQISLDIPEYLQRIEKKTALMFSKSCEFGARVCGASTAESRKLAHFGINLGLAFQIMDDVKDLTHSEEELGKPPGEDLRQGIMTLPLILAAQDSRVRDEIVAVMEVKSPPASLIQDAVGLIAASGALQKTVAMAREYRDRSIHALETFSPTPERRSLERLAVSVTEINNERGILKQEEGLDIF